MTGKFIAIRTNKAGDVILDCSFDGWRWPFKAWLGKASRKLVKLFAWVDNLFQYRVVVSSAMGLGVGVCLTWLVYSQPIATTAQPDTVITTNQLEFQAVRFDSELPWQPLPLTDAQDLEDQTLGSAIELLGHNNGIYQYRIVEIRQVPTPEIYRLKTNWPDNVLLMAPTSIWQTQQLVLVLR